MSGLRIRGLSAGYRGREVVRSLDLEGIAPGTVTALVGPNAAGKSTLLRAMAGLIPASGSVVLDGEDLLALDLDARSARIGFMPQSLPHRVSLSVFESVLVALKASGGAGRMDPRARVMAALDRVDLGDLANEPLDRLSGGQRQLASLAQAIVREPRLLLLDEPTSALDLGHQFAVMSMARSLAEAGGIVIVVLHDLVLAARWADRVAVLRRGALRAFGPADDVLTPEVFADTWAVRGRLMRSPLGVPYLDVDAIGRDTPPE
ncbi:ABC transporter ATP-binding protein [Enterovirga rhinocerotis]|uniref:Iron complex transport system ATP-binding protein n=1 Tax=Enterovirga rhinocerotis TaxID=1339210 RepID=A0A4R7BNY8_9HYPH|nr:ABC transporter ATP-binding protein [Enterovirga rhinocerotis]TDR87071.1 iron complex transport system ATP-binding protein [Enterovirga rhinocerotis]